MEPPDGSAQLPARPDRPSGPWWQAGTWQTTIIALLFGAVTDLWIRRPLGLGLVGVVVVGVVVFAWVVRPNAASRVFLGAGAVVGAFAAMRANPTLQFLDVGTAGILLSLGAGSAAAGSSIAVGVRAYVRRGLNVPRAAPRGFAAVASPSVRAVATSRGRMRIIPRLAMISLPVVAVFVVLLASADAVFAHYLTAPFAALPSFADLPRHVLIVSSGAVVLATFTASGLAAAPAEPSPLDPGERLRRADWVLLLTTVDLVFAAFVAVQFSTLFGGTSHVLAQQGLTVAEYARSGFAQLIVAVVLTGVLIVAVWFFGARQGHMHDRTFAILAGILIVLSLVVLASAFRRLVNYEAAFGWTWPRLEVHLSIVFLAVLLASALVAITLRRGTWLPAVAIGTGVFMLIGLNIMDPDRFIAQHNIARFHDTGSIDINELAHMSADATPFILDALPSLPDPDRTVLTSALACQAKLLGSRPRSVASWNYGRTVALDRLRLAGIAGCP